MAIRRVTYIDAIEGVATDTTDLDVVQFGKLNVAGVAGVGLDMLGSSLVNLATPVNPGDAVNLQYLQMAVQGFSLKPNVLAYADYNIPSLSGTVTIDGVALKAGDRVLLGGQTDATKNGFWVVQASAWKRPDDFKSGTHAAGYACFIEEGTRYGDNGFVCITDPPADVADTNALSFGQFSGAGQIIAGSGIAKSGNTISVALANTPGLQFTSGALDTYLATTGGIAKDGNGLRVLLKDVGTATQTVASDANGVSVLGVPSKFTIAGQPASVSVTSANLGTLTAGSASQADALHTHLSVIGSLAVVGYHMTSNSLAAGDPVAWGPTNNVLVRSDATLSTSARCIGVALTAAAQNTVVPIVKRGIALGALTSGIAGSIYYLNIGGGLSATQPTGQPLRRVRIGTAVNATDLEINIVDGGQSSQ